MKAIKINNKIHSYNVIPSRWVGKKNYIGGFHKLSDSKLQEEGFFDVESPDYDDEIQELGALSFDADKKKFVYTIKNKTWSESVAELKANKIIGLNSQTNHFLSTTDWYITRQSEGIKDIPDSVVASRKSIRDKNIAAETAIGKLSKKTEVIKYKISLT